MAKFDPEEFPRKKEKRQRGGVREAGGPGEVREPIPPLSTEAEPTIPTVEAGSPEEPEEIEEDWINRNIETLPPEVTGFSAVSPFNVDTITAKPEGVSPAEVKKPEEVVRARETRESVQENIQKLEEEYKDLLAKYNQGDKKVLKDLNSNRDKITSQQHKLKFIEEREAREARKKTRIPQVKKPEAKPEEEKIAPAEKLEDLEYRLSNTKNLHAVLQDEYRALTEAIESPELSKEDKDKALRKRGKIIGQIKASNAEWGKLQKEISRLGKELGVPETAPEAIPEAGVSGEPEKIEPVEPESALVENEKFAADLRGIEELLETMEEPLGIPKPEMPETVEGGAGPGIPIEVEEVAGGGPEGGGGEPGGPETITEEIEKETGVEEAETEVTTEEEKITAPISAGAERMIGIVEKQRREEMIELRIKARIRGEKIEDGETKAKTGNKLFGVLSTIGRSISLRTQNLLNIGEARRIRGEVIKEENVLEEKEREYITDLFRDIAEDDPYYESTMQDRDIFQKILENRGLTARILENPTAKKILDHPIIGNLTLGVAIVGGSSLVAKSMLRMGVKMAYGAGFAGGALAGGAIGGFTEYRKAEQAEFDAKKWGEELDKLEDPNDARAFIETLKQKIIEIKKIRGNESSALALMYAVREKELALQKGEQEREPEGEGEREGEEQLAITFEDVGEIIDGRNEIQDETPILEGRGAEIFKRILQEKNKKIRMAAARGALVGATIGGVAGMVGAYLHHAKEIAGGHPPVVPTTVAEHARPSAEISFPHNPRVMHELLDHKNFVALTGRGEGTEVVSGRSLHDYLVNYNGVGGDHIALTKEQFFAARAMLSDEINSGHLWIKSPGEVFTLNGHDIHSVIERVQHMSPAQLEYFKTHVSDHTWEMIDPSRSHALYAGDANNFAEGMLRVKDNADLHAIISHNNPHIEGALMEPVRHIEPVHITGGAVQEEILPSPPAGGIPGGLEGGFTPGVSPEHIYTPAEVASGNGLTVDQQHAFELSNIHDARIPEGSIRNMRQLMLNLENRHESGVIARDPELYEFAKQTGIADLNAGALKHAASQADINAIVDRVSIAARPYLTQEFIDSWRAKWIK